MDWIKLENLGKAIKEASSKKNKKEFPKKIVQEEQNIQKVKIIRELPKPKIPSPKVHLEQKVEHKKKKRKFLRRIDKIKKKHKIKQKIKIKKKEVLGEKNLLESALNDMEKELSKLKKTRRTMQKQMHASSDEIEKIQAEELQLRKKISLLIKRQDYLNHRKSAIKDRISQYSHKIEKVEAIGRELKSF